MGNITNLVDGYQIQFFGKSTSAVAGVKAWLYLRSSEHETGVAGAIGFYSLDALESQQDRLDALGRPLGHMSVTEIGTVLDLLRNENPIYVTWSDIRSQVFLETDPEPVGEGEI